MTPTTFTALRIRSLLFTALAAASLLLQPIVSSAHDGDRRGFHSVKPKPRLSIHVGVGHHAFHNPFWLGWPYHWQTRPATVIVQPASPPPQVVYIEKPAVTSFRADSPATSDGSWYYCASVKKYFPHVEQCPEGWERVAVAAN